MDLLNVLLLGDGFFSRGFLHHIDYNKFNVTQIYKDSFINPQDIMYDLQRNNTYTCSYHFRDLINKYLNKYTKKQLTIESLDIINKNEVEINSNKYNFDYLVIGLGAQKTLKDWSNELNEYNDYNSNSNSNNLSIGIVGMGPIGFELANILSNYKNINKVDMFDMLPKDKVLGYVNDKTKTELLLLLNKKNISTTFEKMYNKTEYNHDKVIFCVGTRPNNLTTNFKVNNYLQIKINDNNNNNYYNNIYLGGDGINSTKYIKTGQLAYQQGKYVAERLNNNQEFNKEFDKEFNKEFDKEFDKEFHKEFEYESNGIALNLGDKKVLIENHNVVPNGIYPDFIIKLYSFLFV
jgi:NADH dehydrogenase FAD-containing subunit